MASLLARVAWDKVAIRTAATFLAVQTIDGHISSHTIASALDTQIPLPPDVIAMVADIDARMDLAAKRLNVFVVGTSSAFSMGSPAFDAAVEQLGVAAFPSGPLLALPRTLLTCSTDRAVAAAAIKGAKVRGASGAVSDHDLKALLQFTTEMAQFTIAHEFAHIKCADSVVAGFYPSVALIAAHETYRARARHARGPLGRLALAAALVAVAVAASVALNWRQEFCADLVAKDVGYAAGGVQRLRQVGRHAALNQAAGPGAWTTLRLRLTHPPPQWRVAALAGEMDTRQAAVHSALTFCRFSCKVHS